jgi:predicted TIM-barrel fold metal-dependent hydrolase
LPSLLAFAKPGHVVFGSDWPFAPPSAVQYFTAGLDDYSGITNHAAIDRDNAAALFSRLASRLSSV